MSNKRSLTSSLVKVMEALGSTTTQLTIVEPIKPFGRKTPPSRFAKVTMSMENARRDLEQAGHRKFGVKVHALERVHEETPIADEGLEIQSGIEANPLLADNQRFDGIDNSVNPEPALNSAARREFDNERREQEKEKQLRLGNMPQMGRTFNPKPERR